MKVEEIKKYIHKLERENKFSDSLKYKIMKSVEADYNLRKTNVGQSLVSKAMAGELALLPDLPPFRVAGRPLNNREISEVPLFAFTQTINILKIHTVWLDLMDYLNHSNNFGKTLHSVIKEKIEEIILDNHPSIRYATGHVSNAGMHRLNIFAQTIITPTAVDISREEIQSETLGLNIVIGGLNCLTVAVCSPYNLFKGVLNAAIRQPASITEQKALLDKLELITEEAQRELLMEQIFNKYTKKFYYSSSLKFDSRSHSSRQLYRIWLRDSSISTADKWKALLSYVEEREGDCLKNNGKNLFNCIKEVVMNDNLAIVRPGMQFR